jgi:hypothetical protein
MFSKDNGSEIMVYKKSDAKPLACSRVSLASRLLGSALRAPLTVPPLQEPWRNRKPKGKSRGKRHK